MLKSGYGGMDSASNESKSYLYLVEKLTTRDCIKIETVKLYSLVQHEKETLLLTEKII